MTRARASLPQLRWLIAAVAVTLTLATLIVRRRTANASKLHVIRITCSLAASNTQRAFSGLTAVIVANGWLERELDKRGVAIEWVPVPGASVGATVNEGFASGTIDIASYGDLPSIIANAAGVRTELVVPSGRGSDTYLLVPPDSSAHSISDLKGKRIAIHRGRPWELPFSRLVDSVGLTYNDFSVLNLDPQAGAAALGARKVDALYTITPYLLVDKGVGKIIWSTAEAPPDWKMRAELWVSHDFAARNPEITQVVATAYVHAAHWAASHRDEMLQILSIGGTPLQVLSKDYGEGDAWRDRWSPLFDAPLLAHYEHAISYAREKQIIPRGLDFRECYDEHFVHRALEDLGLQGFWHPWAPARSTNEQSDAAKDE
jgi:sulfonate transport system substrate-binding protein